MKMKNNGKTVMSVLLLAAFFCLSFGQESEDLLGPLIDNLQVNFLSQLQAQGIEVTNVQRAKFIGYILNRQSHYLGEFETDRIMMRKLIQQVKEFMGSISPREDLWPIVEAGLADRYREEVHSLLGGSPYVEPLFPSLGKALERHYDLVFDMWEFEKHPDKTEIMDTARRFLTVLKEKRFAEIPPLIAGRFAEEWSKMTEAMRDGSRDGQEMTAFFEQMDWLLAEAAMTSTKPQVARLQWAISMPDGDMEVFDMLLIYDAGTWRIVRFDE